MVTATGTRKDSTGTSRMRSWIAGKPSRTTPKRAMKGLQPHSVLVYAVPSVIGGKYWEGCVCTIGRPAGVCDEYDLALP